MLYIKNIDDGAAIFKALGSELRIRIIKTLLENREMNMGELASALGITNGALTSHIKKLEESGIVTILSEYSGHGNQKVCRMNIDKILIDIATKNTDTEADSYTIDIPIGNYFNYVIFPTCGLSNTKNLIGTVDDPRFFAHPSHVDAQILWFAKGHIDYLIPNMLPAGQKIDQLTISFEISSEAPGINSDWPSDISFFLNGVRLGMWTSPGDFGDVHGMFTPSWWFPNWNQYGLLKMLTVNRKGTFMDGLPISDVTIGDLKLDGTQVFNLRFAVDQRAAHVGGLTIFGKTFGNYAQDIQVSLGYVADPAAGRMG